MQEAGGEGFGLDRIVLPMSSLASWALIAIGGLTGLHVVGLNIQPLLAVGGISGLAIGLGAQTVTANAIAGINLVSPESQLMQVLLLGYLARLGVSNCILQHQEQCRKRLLVARMPGR